MTKQRNTLPKTQHPDTHYKVMDLIQKNPDITQRQLASKLDISLGSIHYCLKALAHKGWLKAGNFKQNPNKSAYLYLLTTKGITHKSKLAIEFLRRKKNEYEKLKSEIEELSKALNEKN
ncbi:MarR family EPS-associated transcriptional regulator [Methylophilaceae bacterium]|jgi:EPS-associated MarR family transcriptional regulator|nr:MarR family EPS-associated transcriptional regulator [Methylophilaceae bacterium]